MLLLKSPTTNITISVEGNYSRNVIVTANHGEFYHEFRPINESTYLGTKPIRS